MVTQKYMAELIQQAYNRSASKDNKIVTSIDAFFQERGYISDKQIKRLKDISGMTLKSKLNSPRVTVTSVVVDPPPSDFSLNRLIDWSDAVRTNLQDMIGMRMEDVNPREVSRRVEIASNQSSNSLRTIYDENGRVVSIANISSVALNTSVGRIEPGQFIEYSAGQGPLARDVIVRRDSAEEIRSMWDVQIRNTVPSVPRQMTRSEFNIQMEANRSVGVSPELYEEELRRRGLEAIIEDNSPTMVPNCGIAGCTTCTLVTREPRGPRVNVGESIPFTRYIEDIGNIRSSVNLSVDDWTD